MPTAPRQLVFQFLGRRPYRATWDLQNKTADALRTASSDARETLFFVEHRPVITLGRRAQPTDVLIDEAALAARGVDLVQVDRGGDVTYHGPGQLVIYPVVRVRPFGVGDLVRGLAGAVNDVLSSYGVEATYDIENPGLWVEGAKICAVGMRVSRGVSTHGAALNVTTSLDAFQMIVPCGMPDARAVALAGLLALTGQKVPTLEVLARSIAAHFADRFGFSVEF